MIVPVDLLALASNASYLSSVTGSAPLYATSNGSDYVPSISLLAYDGSFASSVLFPNASASLVLELPWQAFHEGGVYHAADNTLHVSSNFVSLNDPINITVLSLDDYSVRSVRYGGIAEANGGTTYYPPGSSGSDDGSRRPPLQVWADEGDLQSPSRLVAVDPGAITAATASGSTVDGGNKDGAGTLLTSFLGGRNFSSLNDVRQHPVTGDLWFTDADYGYYQNFRPAPAIPKQVYRFEPATGRLRAVADGFNQPNGLEFSPDLRTLYVTDTGANEFSLNATRPSTIYAFDVVDDDDYDRGGEGGRHGHGHGGDGKGRGKGGGKDRGRRATGLANRRVFAYSDSGNPDGIHADTAGNVWAACGDGLHVWNPRGDLVGKVYIGETSNNFAFVPDAVLVFSNYRLWKVAGLRVQGREVCKDFGYKCTHPDPSANITRRDW